MTIIKIENLSKKFNGKPVLEDLSFSIDKGEIHVVLGESGCGKSTLLKLIIGLLTPDSGSIYIKDKNVLDMPEDEFDELRKKIGFVFQGAALFNSMTVGENVALPLKEHTKLCDNVIDANVKMFLELVNLVGFENFKPAEISGGMKKRAGLARAIALNPEIVLYDEPGAGLDPIARAVIDQLIRDLSKKLGMTSIVVTHEIESAFRIADKISLLYDGKFQETGTVHEIKNTKNPIVKQFITGDPEGPLTIKKSKDEYLKLINGKKTMES